MGDVVRTSSQPMLGAIRLAWWRERLEELGAGAVPAEPRLQAAARELLPRGIAGAELAAQGQGWLGMFDEFPWSWASARAIAGRGAILFRLAAELLGPAGERVERAGALWALVDAARHCSDAASRALLADEARARLPEIGSARFAAAARPLTMLAAIAVRDLKLGEPFEAESSPRRVAAMLRHRLTGRL